jgi:preprotein translocase subunit SecF
VSPVERRDDRLRNVEIPNRLVDDRDQPEDLEVEDVGELDDEFEDETEFGADDVPAGKRKAGSGSGSGSGGGFPLKTLLRLYRGQTSFDFVGRRRWWFLLSSVIIVAGLVSFGFRGFNFGIDFKGGESWEVSATGVSQATVVTAVEAAGLSQPVVEILGGKTIEVQADLNSLSAAKRLAIEDRVNTALEKFAGPGQEVSQDTVGPTWGGQVTEHALIALIAFFITVGIYISLRFEPKMAAGRLHRHVHDLLVAVGVYSFFNSR